MECLLLVGQRGRDITRRLDSTTMAEVELSRRTCTSNSNSNNNMYASVANNDEDDNNNDDEEEALSGSNHPAGAVADADHSHHSMAAPPRSFWTARRRRFRCGGAYGWFLGATFLAAVGVGLYRYRDGGLFSSGSFTASLLSSKNQDGAAAVTTADDGTGVACNVGNKFSSPFTVTYDPSVASVPWNPLDLNVVKDAALLSPPSRSGIDTENNDRDDDARLGYILQPDLVNQTLVFVADGDLYWTRLPLSSSSSSSSSPPTVAVRLSVTVGNVRTPKINPIYPYLIAYTATYQARRDVYLLDLRHGTAAAQRLTYFDSAYGVSSVAGWSADGTTLRFGAVSNQVGLRDPRLYEIALAQPQQHSQTNHPPMQVLVLETRPVPLAQATEGVGFGDDDACLVFVRYKQGSWTARYVGGTAEGLWAYCHGRERAVHLTSDYRGTSKNPNVVAAAYGGQQRYLLFLSDRSRISSGSGGAAAGNPVFQSGNNTWRATTMNLYAAPLPTADELYANDNYVLRNVVQLTRVSCQFQGRAVREYTVDAVTGDVLLRIGADLYHLSAERIRATLQSDGGSTTTMAVPTRVPVAVYSDFHELQERHIPVRVLQHLTAVDAFDTHFDTTAALLTLRGQVWVAPVVTEGGGGDAGSTVAAPSYQGAGQNMPARRYRVVPGAMTGGAIRVLGRGG